jgi:hypothetical protein
MDAKNNLAAGPKALIVDPTVNGNPTATDPYGTNPDNPTMTAGSTFVDQFTDHDITFDQTSQLGVPQNPLISLNTRTPALDLDSGVRGRAGKAARSVRAAPERRRNSPFDRWRIHQLPRSCTRARTASAPVAADKLSAAGRSQGARLRSRQPLPRQPEHRAAGVTERRVPREPTAIEAPAVALTITHQPKGRSAMPLINVKPIEDIFTPEQGNETVVEGGPVRAKLAANSNETVVEDGPVRAKLAANSNETVVEDADF